MTADFPQFDGQIIRPIQQCVTQSPDFRRPGPVVATSTAIFTANAILTQSVKMITADQAGMAYGLS